MSNYLTRSVLTFAFLLLTLAGTAAAQSNTATLTGTLQDENAAVIPGVDIEVRNIATSTVRHATTNESGFFTVPLLQPGTYSVTARRDGFTTVRVPEVILNVGDQKAMTIQLKVGSVSTEVIVQDDPSLVRTDGSVGTVVDRQFVQNIPLNGRSFQSLLELTPGVVVAPAGGGGQFSVNGQRTNQNYVTVDGVSANAATTPLSGGFAGPEASGQLPSLTASGTTASLVSVDALQEFRIQTSSYAAEFGRQPGGQVQLVTRAGGNDFHGTVFDYVRNEAFDANDWFANRSGFRRAPMRQQMFGGTFSGPIFFPNFGDDGSRWYNGRSKTFFFFSYEGLRLQLPQTQDTRVPSLCLRGKGSCGPGQSPALPQFHAILNAHPLPNGPDLGGGSAQLVASYSDPSRYDATSVRLDHTVGKFNFFGRFSNTPSKSSRRLGNLSAVQNVQQDNTTITAGSSWTISGKIVNDLRANYATTGGPVTQELTDFGGAVPLQTLGFLGRNPDTAFITFQLPVGVAPVVPLGNLVPFKQRQFNIIDNLTATVGDHQLKFGVDFRRSNPLLQTGGASGIEVVAMTLPLLLTGHVQSYSINTFDAVAHAAAFDNLSAYAQDTWKVNRRLTLTYGLRWEFVPPPHATEGPDAITLDGLDNPLAANNLSVAPLGTPLWETRYSNFAPRLGASYVLIEKPGRQIVIRGGAGIFYDLGLGSSAEGFARAWPNAANISYPIANHPDPACRPPLVFPLPPCALVGSQLGSGSPALLNIMARDIELPRTYQWNFSAEQSLGANQSLTVSYVGAAARKLLWQSTYTSVRLRNIPYIGSATTQVRLQHNLGYSDYEALQVQFQRRLSKGFQALVSYTMSQSKDAGSADSEGVPIEAVRPEEQYGYSSFDVRHNLTAAVTYQLPSFKGNSILNAISRDWGVDMMFRARTGFPVNVTASIPFPPLPTNLSVRPNVVPGQPFWIDTPNAPGGRQLNRLAFDIPPSGTVGDLPKGVIRGFGVKQIDLSLRREFPMFEKVRLQLRVEAFNLFNWPNFANPGVSISQLPSDPVQRQQVLDNFGKSGSMLNRGSTSGLNALYQSGGPRSMQGAIRILF